MDMPNTIKQLKQQNEAAFNFALAGMVALILSVIGLALLVHGLTEQKQIAKQVGDLQITSRTIEAIVSSSKLDFGEVAAFLEFEKSVNSFNQQWTEFKQQHNYSDKTIKELETVWQRINRNAQKILLMKKDMMALKAVVDEAFVDLKTMYKMNDELVSILLSHNVNSRQVLMAKELTVLLFREERSIASIYNGDENAVISEDDFGYGNLHQIGMVLNGFLSGDLDEGIKKIEDVKAREVIENQMILYKKIDSHANTILKMSPILFQVREAQSAIFRDAPELKSSLTKLNNHQLNTGLMVLTLCGWLCVFACVYGYVRALKTK
jgi:twitching motility protein PilJ